MCSCGRGIGWHNSAMRLLGVVSALALGLLALTGACTQSRNPTDDEDRPCSDADVKGILHEHMLDAYVWWDQMPEVDIDAYADPAALLGALRVDPPDRWSYVVPKAVDDAYFAGDGYVGVGVVTISDAAGALHIAEVYPGSPAAHGGLERGDEILAIGGESVLAIDAAGTWDEAWGERVVGVSVSLQIRDGADSERTVLLTKDVVVPPSIVAQTIFDVAGRRVAYLALDRFITPTTDELRAAFATFVAGGVDDLVVDLRYNGGGYVSVARYLAELIGGARSATQVFAHVAFNSKHRASDYDERMGSVPNALGLGRVVFITAAGTASASELVINGLAPFLEVVRVGTTTHGKPVGMVPVDFCDLTLAPVTFELSNAVGDGAYYDGLDPTCEAADDLSAALGDPAESSLAEALYYLEHGACTTASLVSHTLAARSFQRRNRPLTGFDAVVGAR